MSAHLDTFLPHIESAFYATFHETRGPQILYQVPEGLISQGSGTGNSLTNLTSRSGNSCQLPARGYAEPPNHSLPSVSTTAVATPSSSTTSLSSSDVTKISESPGRMHRPSNASSISTLDMPSPSSPASSRSLQQHRHLQAYSPSDSPRKSVSPRSAFGPTSMLDFSDISRFVIPTQDMCGRLVICATQRHRIIGFPVCLDSEAKYKRNHFIYNLCFVFERTADLSCYEPVVRKIARVLMACEEESSFLSGPNTASQIHPILEQLYEDLNSYHETSITIDQFNSIELKLFPFYPNPPVVYDWTVPLSLINIAKRIEPNWDLTMIKVCEHIDGISHVSRIANLADCDLELTRQAISHLLYYQCIIAVDIFQYSNIYTLERSFQWLANDPSVKDECGPYVTLPGFDIPDWSHFLFLYSRLKPGRTVFEWEEDHNVRAQGIDVRRLVSFGVIKGFLRRIHRWPILMPAKPRVSQENDVVDPKLTIGRKRGKSLSNTVPPKSNKPHSPDLKRERSHSHSQTPTSTDTRPARKLTEAEEYARSVQLREASSTGGETGHRRPRSVIHQEVTDSRRISMTDPPQLRHQPSGTLSPVGTGTPHLYPKMLPGGGSDTRRTSQFRPNQYRTSLSPDAGSYTNQSQLHTLNFPSYPPELPTFLDGTHHTDELATRFEVGWPVLEKWLIALGDGQGNGDFGRVAIMYR